MKISTKSMNKGDDLGIVSLSYKLESLSSEMWGQWVFAIFCSRAFVLLIYNIHKQLKDTKQVAESLRMRISHKLSANQQRCSAMEEAGQAV